MHDTVTGESVAPARPSRRRRGRWFSWTIVTFLAAWALVRLLGWETGSFLTQLMTMTPYAAAFALVMGLFLLVRRAWRPAVAALAVCAALAAAVLPRAVTGSTASGTELRVLALNMFGRADPEAVVDLVRRHRPHVLSALELTPGQVERLDEAGLKELMPHRVLEPEYSASGSGLYSTLPLTRLDGLFTPIGHHMPAASLALPGAGTVQVVAVHPNPPLGRMTAEWNASLAALPPPSASEIRVLAGDFNASLDHRAFRDLLARGYVDAADQAGKGLVPTWPNSRRLPVPPFITIDHVVADARVSVAGVEVHDVPGTDHRAVFADLRLPRG
ncbi:endonuclease/exonuclease/phosphatase family protein [Nonomuraea soli]|uniref:Endonuclease/exonuclease/phosphatase (EEP) superfamily protein YafD n=1 Tax=Nonomuraea soli TaxID=1032476 RepID=A0A7W0CRX4_9ACTN|nr:endonuclease/exonuclease/phosphatase family protein [Nonomuraea soli]MBA2896147.1 endonuclease/exonuclease/phosphatase (EEP) superfamily protein YafD [Nonomuraea soli]